MYVCYPVSLVLEDCALRIHCRELNCSRTRQVFLNVVLDDAVEEKDGGERVKLGMVVSLNDTGFCGWLLKSYTGYSREFSGYAGGIFCDTFCCDT